MIKKYGLVGHPLGHTLSPFIHNILMKSQKIKGEYKVYDISPNDFDSKIKKIMQNLDGFNITIPYKNRITSHIDTLSIDAKKCGAVNTVTNKCGYNTDLYGFRMCNIPLEGMKVLLLGAGGAARMMLHECIFANAKEITIFSRNISKVNDFINDIKSNTNNSIDFSIIKASSNSDTLNPPYDVILNATPVGMWPHCNEIPIDKEIIIGAKYLFDSIYNPLSTKLILLAKAQGIKCENGLAMLYYQALEAQKIWNPDFEFLNIDHKKNLLKIKKKINTMFNTKFILTGFMGCGKSTVGKRLAKKIGIEFVDLDIFIVEKTKMSIGEIFEKFGEDAFRKIESEYFLHLLQEPNPMVIATGGGAMIQKDNVENAKKFNATIFLLNVCIETVIKRVGNGADRPLLSGDAKEKARKLFCERANLYLNVADVIIDGEGDIKTVAKRIAEVMDF